MKPADVPGGPLLIDTDVLSYWITQSASGDPFSALVSGHEQAISFATQAELLADAYRNAWGWRRLDDLRQRLREFVVIPYNSDVVDMWAQMNAKLAGADRIDTNDLWTAACSLVTVPRLPIVTDDLEAYQLIESAFPVRLVHPDR